MCYICNICHICNIHTICDIINVCNICNGYNMQYKQYTKDIALQLFAWCVQYQSKLKLKYIPPTRGPKGPKKPNKLHIPPQMIITISMWTSTDTPPPSVGMIYTISILTSSWKFLLSLYFWTNESISSYVVCLNDWQQWWAGMAHGPLGEVGGGVCSA